MGIVDDIIQAGEDALNNPLNENTLPGAVEQNVIPLEIKHHNRLPDVIHLAQEPCVANTRYHWCTQEIGKSFIVKTLWAIIDLEANPGFRANCEIFRINPFTQQKEISFTVELNYQNVDKVYKGCAVWIIPHNVLGGATDLALVANTSLSRMSLFGQDSTFSFIMGSETDDVIPGDYWD